MPSKYISVAGVATNYFHAPPTTLPTQPPSLNRGAAMLFVHGAGSNGHTWQRQVDHFGAAHSPLALDFPGHGRSGSTEGLASIAAYRDFTLAFADAVRLPPAVVIGRSMGGAVAIEMALAAPERVRALVLVATAARFELADEMIETWRQVTLGRQTQPFTTGAFSPATDFAVVREAWMEQVKTDPRVRYHDFVACNACDLSPRLGQVRQPTLIVAGRDDTIAPVAKSEQLHAAIPGSRFVVMENAGHTIPSEQPAEFNRALEEFVQSLG